MGSISAANSINRVLESHGNEIREEMLSQVPEGARQTVTDVALENNGYSIGITWMMGTEGIPGPEIDIDTLAERYPDCNVGY